MNDDEKTRCSKNAEKVKILMKNQNQFVICRVSSRQIDYIAVRSFGNSMKKYIYSRVQI